MSFELALLSLGSVPYLSTRLFSTLFWVGMVGLAQQHYGMFQTQLGFLQLDLTLQLPDWYLTPQFLAILFLLAWAEGSTERSPLISEILRVFDAELKAVGNFLLEHFVTVGAAVSLAGGLLAGATVYQAGFGIETLWALLVSGAVWGVAKLRGAFLAILTEMDDGDDLGIRRLIGWLEELWVAFGVWLLFINALIALFVAGATVLGLFLVQRYLRSREEASKIPCPNCRTPNLPAALSCLSCGEPLPEPRKVGVLGYATTKPVTDPGTHQLELLTKRRCLVCATRLPKRSVRQPCSGCGREMFPSVEWLDRYLLHAQQRLPKTLGICFALSFLPFLGLIPGILYYRLGLISSLRVYVPLGTGCVTRWVIRIVNLILLCLQWIPVLGSVTLPAMCLVNYTIYRKVLLGEKRKQFG